MNTVENHNPPREHPRKYEWIPVIPLLITLIICVLSLDELYKIWLEPIGLHLWMEDAFPRGFSGFDKYTNDPLRYKVTFSWIILVSGFSGLLVSLCSIGLFYRYITRSPRTYIIAACIYLFSLSFFLFVIHGPSQPDWTPARSERSLFFNDLFSFAFWSVSLSLSAFYAWSVLLAYIIAVVRRLVRLEIKQIELTDYD
jgi:hypothetical protein